MNSCFACANFAGGEALCLGLSVCPTIMHSCSASANFAGGEALCFWIVCLSKMHSCYASANFVGGETLCFWTVCPSIIHSNASANFGESIMYLGCLSIKPFIMHFCSAYTNFVGQRQYVSQLSVSSSAMYLATTIPPNSTI